MKHSTRREFIKTGETAVAALSVAGLPFEKGQKPLLSFSTLGCPDWPFDKILQFAVDNQYDGIELRGILRELDLTKRAEFNTPEHLKATRDNIGEKKLTIV